MSTLDPHDLGPHGLDPHAPASSDLASSHAAVDADGARVRMLLLERAASVTPRAAPVGQVVRRARRTRHRRTSVAIGAGLSAAAAVGAVVVVGGGPSPSDDVELGVAGGDPTVPPTTADQVFHPEPTATIPAAVGPPLRMGLDVPGATVTSVSDTPEADVDPGAPTSVGVTFRDPSGTRMLSVLVAFDVPPAFSPGPPPDATVLPMPPTSIVDAGDDGQWVLTRVPVPQPDGSNSPGVLLRIERGDDWVQLIATGLTDEEVLAVGRGIVLGPDASLRVMGLPADLVGRASRIPLVGAGGGVRSQVVYRLPDGGDAVVDVVSRPDGRFIDDREQARSAPTPDVHLTQVRGADAVVRRFPGIGAGGGEVVTVTWLEPSGNLVTVRLEPAGAGVGDPDVVVSGIVELDEAAFQAILADPGPT